MANADAPFGLRPVRYLSGAPYSGAANRYFVPASDGTAIYLGGLVKIAGSADADGVMTVTGNVASGDAVIGVVVGVEPITDESTIFRAASTARYVFVADDPTLLFEVQEDSVGSNLAAANVGGTAELTGFTSGSTFTGLSAIEIDSSEPGTDAADDVFIFGLVQRPDNAIGANANWLVRLNNHQLVDGTAGA
jgi:hypothetical protein